MGRTRTTESLALGRLYATKEALAACKAADVELLTLLERHTRGDGGDLGLQEIHILSGARVKSSYPLPTQKTVWLITEPDRSVTLLLLPEEF